jgi:putative YphP/YqiW family bacilliredoxin
MNFPTYDPAAVQPMRDELIETGFEELLTSERVEEVLKAPEETVLIVINSVCGCAAGNARPGITMALQNERIPDRLTTVFAGQDKLSVGKVREILSDFPPSSPFIALLRDGKALHALERRNIENKTADEVASELVSWFNQDCHRQGPAIPREAFEKLVPYRACGSTIPVASAGE